MSLSLLKKLLGRAPAPDPVNSLHIGTSDRRRVTVPTPAVIRTMGTAGSGRCSFLMELAGQAIQKGWGVVYVDLYGSGRNFYDLQSLAGKVGREKEAVGVAFVTPTEGGLVRKTSIEVLEDPCNFAEASVETVVGAGGILYWGLCSFDLKRSQTYGLVRSLLDELISTVERRDEAVKPLLIVFDDSVRCLKELLPAFEWLTMLAKGRNVSLVFSSNDASDDPADMDVHVSCAVLHSLEDPSSLRPEVQAVVGALHNGMWRVKEQCEGQAVVVLSANIAAQREVLPVSLVYTPIERRRVASKVEA
jgi:hypothetical protein